MVAPGDGRHPCTDVDDDAGTLVTEDDREQTLRVGARTREFVRVTYAGGLDLDENFPRARSVEVDGLDDERLAGLVADGGTSFHAGCSGRRESSERSATVRAVQPTPGHALQPLARLLHRNHIDGSLAEETTMKFLTRCTVTVLYAYSAVALGAASAANGDVSRVNGSVTIEQGQQAGEVSTVNGSVSVGADARVGAVETVNGSVKIAERAVVDTAETVNGGIVVGTDAAVLGKAEAVNGSVTLRRGARVGGGLHNVNGDILVDGAAVSGGVTTTNGDIRLTAGASVSGGIHVKQNRGRWFSFGSESRNNPRVTIEQGAVLQGPLHFEREVDLYVAPGVELPEVQGVAPRRYALD